mgnify:CR=1 FL=1
MHFHPRNEAKLSGMNYQVGGKVNLNPKPRSCGALFLQEADDLLKFSIAPMAERFFTIRCGAFEVIWKVCIFFHKAFAPDLASHGLISQIGCHAKPFQIR